jgi:hypothetical protein
MISFKDYLRESTNAGNYVSIKCSDLGRFFDALYVTPPKSGESPPAGDYHCTLMYSKGSSVPPNRIQKFLDANFSAPITCNIVGIDCFDSIPKDGSRDAAKSCLVLKLDNPTLGIIHNSLVPFGLKHSYAEYNPHVTLRYNMSVTEAHVYRDMLNEFPELRELTLTLRTIKSETVNEDYV